MQQALHRSSLVPRGFVVENAYFEGDKTLVAVRAFGSVGLCPSCGTVSRRVHSRYRRRATDLPLSWMRQATYDQALADRDLARLNLERATVRAPVNGKLTNFHLRPGDYVTPGAPVTALVDQDTFYVVGYFEETKLSKIHVGDAVRVSIMGDATALEGRVASIAGGIEDRERADTASLLANVNPTFTWVRLAQRVPVRISLGEHTATTLVSSPVVPPPSR